VIRQQQQLVGLHVSRRKLSSIFYENSSWDVGYQVLSFAKRMGSEMNFYCWVGVEVVQRWEAVAV